MKIAVIKNADQPDIAEFLKDKNGNNLIFNSWAEHEDYMMDNSESGVYYRCFDDEED